MCAHWLAVPELGTLIWNANQSGPLKFVCVCVFTKCTSTGLASRYARFQKLLLFISVCLPVPASNAPFRSMSCYDLFIKSL